MNTARSSDKFHAALAYETEQVRAALGRRDWRTTRMFYAVSAFALSLLFLVNFRVPLRLDGWSLAAGIATMLSVVWRAWTLDHLDRIQRSHALAALADVLDWARFQPDPARALVQVQTQLELLRIEAA